MRLSVTVHKFNPLQTRKRLLKEEPQRRSKPTRYRTMKERGFKSRPRQK